MPNFIWHGSLAVFYRLDFKMEYPGNQSKELKDKLRQVILDEVIDNNYRPYGEQYSPTWIFDFRMVLLEPTWLACITNLLYEYIKEYDEVQIGGLESAALPLVTSLVLKASREGKAVNGFYIRKSRKKSGTFKLFEGRLTDRPIVLVDDLMNSSSSITRQVLQLEEYGKRVAKVLTIVRFRPLAEYSFLQKRGITVESLFSLVDFNLSFKGETRWPDIVEPKIQWIHRPETHTPYNVFPRSRPTVAKEITFFGCDDGYFYACDIETGAVRWRHRVGRCSKGKCILSSPTVNGEIVYFGAYDGVVYALNIYDGSVVWTFAEAEWVGSSPCVVENKGLLYIGLEYNMPQQKGSIIALNSKTGERKWEFPMSALTHASPIYVAEQNRIYVGGNEGVMYALDADTGELDWKFETKGGSRYLGQGGFSPGDIKLMPVYDKDTETIAFSSMDGRVYVLNALEGNQKFVFETDVDGTKVLAGIYGEPIFTEQYIIFAALDKYVYCYDKYTGKLVWSVATSARIFSSPRLLQGMVLVGSNDGFLYVIDEEQGTVEKKYSFPDRIVCPVTIEVKEDKTLLLVMTNTTSVYCITYP